VWALILFALGWTVGAAERPQPEFMIAIDAPVGQTHVECLSGCKLVGARDLPNPRAGLMRVYSYGCSGGNVQRCGAQVAAGGFNRHNGAVTWVAVSRRHLAEIQRVSLVPHKPGRGRLGSVQALAASPLSASAACSSCSRSVPAAS